MSPGDVALLLVVRRVHIHSQLWRFNVYIIHSIKMYYFSLFNDVIMRYFDRQGIIGIINL